MEDRAPSHSPIIPANIHVAAAQHNAPAASSCGSACGKPAHGPPPPAPAPPRGLLAPLPPPARPDGMHLRSMQPPRLPTPLVDAVLLLLLLAVAVVVAAARSCRRRRTAWLLGICLLAEEERKGAFIESRRVRLRTIEEEARFKYGASCRTCGRNQESQRKSLCVPTPSWFVSPSCPNKQVVFLSFLTSSLLSLSASSLAVLLVFLPNRPLSTPTRSIHADLDLSSSSARRKSASHACALAATTRFWGLPTERR